MSANHERNETSGVGNFVTAQTSLVRVRTRQRAMLNTSRRHTGIDGVLYCAMKNMPNDDFVNVFSSFLKQLEVALADEQVVWRNICVSVRARAQRGKMVLLHTVALDKLFQLCIILRHRLWRTRGSMEAALVGPTSCKTLNGRNKSELGLIDRAPRSEVWKVVSTWVASLEMQQI